MPDYIYTDTRHHTRVISHSMLENPRIICPFCRASMWRKPQKIAVNWNGLPPHLESARPTFLQNFIDTAPERRAHYLDTQENK